MNTDRELIGFRLHARSADGQDHIAGIMFEYDENMKYDGPPIYPGRVISRAKLNAVRLNAAYRGPQ